MSLTLLWFILGRAHAATSWKQTVWENVFTSKITPVFMKMTKENLPSTLQRSLIPVILLPPINNLLGRSMKASLMLRAPLCFVWELVMPVNADSSLTSYCAQALQPISRVKCWCLGEPLSPRTAVNRAALRLKKTVSSHTHGSWEEKREPLGPAGSLCLSRIYLRLQYSWHCLFKC